jgi:LPXTG-motif cell wall-anchored protein
MSRVRAALAVLAMAVAGLFPFMPRAVAATGNEVTANLTFSCTVVLGPTTFPAYAWNPTVTVSMIRPKKSTLVTVTAHTTDMAPAAPVPLNYDVTNSMVLNIDGAAVNLDGSGHVTTTAGAAPFPLPDTTGTFTSSAPDVAAVLTSFVFAFPTAGMTGTCTPTGSASLGRVTISDGTPAPPKITATTTTSASAMPRASASASASSSAGASGAPARGAVTYACVLHPLGTAFAYNPTITVAGYRSSPSAAVSLSATMTNLPGIAPVEINGTMNVTLGLTVGGVKTTLAGTSNAKAAPKQTVAVPTLTGTVSASGDELKVLVRTFTFNFPTMSIDASCTAKSVSIGSLTVGTESSSNSSGSGTSTDSGTLPATGTSNVGQVLAWGLGLIAIGVSGLVLLRRRTSVQ